jgi:AcrR family transcriptional regulator
MAAPAARRPPRRDAVRNRARLVEAAARAFREEGLGASVNAIAGDAGVNVATLYRHFPAKQDLIEAVLETILEPLVAARDRALATDEAGTALATFVRQAARLQAVDRGLADALRHPPPAADVRARLREPAVAIVAPLVERAHREGELRPDFGAADVLIALWMLGGITEQPELGPAGAARYVDVVLRGLRPG